MAAKNRVCMNLERTKVVDCDSAEATWVLSQEDADKELEAAKAQAKANRGRKSENTDGE